MKKLFLLPAIPVLTFGLILPSDCYAMDDIASKPPVTSYQLSILPEVKDQIDHARTYAQNLKQSQQEAYLILGAANDELDSLKDKSKEKNWIFWNLSSHEGGTSIQGGNPFIDADFNNIPNLHYASDQLPDTFTKIIIPQQPIEYSKWKMPELKLWHSMLRPGGSFIFALDWLGGNEIRIEYKSADQEDSLNLTTPEFINKINGFDLAYDKREDYLAKTYNFPLDHIFGYMSLVIPIIKNEEFKLTATLSTLEIERGEKYVEEYFSLIEDPQHQNNAPEDMVANILNNDKIRLNKDFTLKCVFQKHYYNGTSFFTREEAKSLFSNKILIEKFNNHTYTLCSKLREEWLVREFNKVFSSVEVSDIHPNSSLNDIPSRSFKLGERNILLIK